MIMPKQPRILTLNHHETYLCLLGKLQCPMDVLVRWRGQDLSWAPQARRAPDHFQLREDDDAVRSELKNGVYDLVILHTVQDLLRFFAFRKPSYVFVAHLFLRWNSPQAMLKSLVKLATWLAFRWTHQARMVVISPGKQRSWLFQSELITNIPGEVPELDPIGDERPYLIIGNNIASRGPEGGFDRIQAIMNRLPLRIVGRNPNIPGALFPKSSNDFFDMIRKGKVYLFLIPAPYEDAYNLGMLEAMKMGMPVVTLQRPDSLITHGHDGLVAQTLNELVTTAQSLVHNEELRLRLGQNAKKTVNTLFSETSFVAKWRALIAALTR